MAVSIFKVLLVSYETKRPERPKRIRFHPQSHSFACFHAYKQVIGLGYLSTLNLQIQPAVDGNYAGGQTESLFSKQSRRTSIYIAFPLCRELWAISGRHTGGYVPATRKCCALYIREFNMGIRIQGDLKINLSGPQRMALPASFAQHASPALFPILLCLELLRMGLGSGLCQVVSLPSFKRPHSTKELRPPQTCNTAFSMPPPRLGSLGPWNCRSHFWSLHSFYTGKEKRGWYSLMPSLLQVVSSLGEGKTLKREVMVDRNWRTGLLSPTLRLSSLSILNSHS